MNENGGIYGGCFDCEDCKEQDLYCEDCSMYEYDKYRLSNQENNNLKNTLLDVAQNFDKMSDSEKVEVNDNVRKQFGNIIHGNPPKTEREKEIDKLAREELEEYRRKKKAFYDNPIHWNNNKRRRHGLPVLRGIVNKYRLKEYPGFFPSVRFFCMMEDLFDEILITTMEDNLNSFVEVKDLAVGDANVFRVSEQENNSMNKRQKKKLFKQTLIKVRKLHPQKGDVICFQPDLDWIDVNTMCQFMNLYADNKVFGEVILAFIPADIKQLRHKKDAQIYINKLQSIVDQMEE